MPDRGVQSTTPPPESGAERAGRFMELAQAMQKDEDLAVLRRFGDLHMFQLIVLQSELDQLRSDFQQACRVEEPLYKAMPYNYLAIDPLEEEGVEEQAKTTQRKKDELKVILASKIKSKLKEYNETLLLESQIRNFDTPERAEVAYLRAWISPEIGGAALSEADRDCWSADHNDDFVSLRLPESRQNTFLAYANFWFQIIYYKAWGYRQSSSNQIDTKIINFNPEKQRLSRLTVQKRLALSSRLIMALFGGVALILPTVIMVLFPYPNTCLITTSAATVIFALILAFGARDSTGKDVLAATAAYTAVLVVFLGSSIGGG